MFRVSLTFLSPASSRRTCEPRTSSRPTSVTQQSRPLPPPSLPPHPLHPSCNITPPPAPPPRARPSTPLFHGVQGRGFRLTASDRGERPLKLHSGQSAVNIVNRPQRAPPEPQQQHNGQLQSCGRPVRAR